MPPKKKEKKTWGVTSCTDALEPLDGVVVEVEGGVLEKLCLECAVHPPERRGRCLRRRSARPRTRGGHRPQTPTPPRRPASACGRQSRRAAKDRGAACGPAVPMATTRRGRRLPLRCVRCACVARARAAQSISRGGGRDVYVVSRCVEKFAAVSPIRHAVRAPTCRACVRGWTGASDTGGRALVGSSTTSLAASSFSTPRDQTATWSVPAWKDCLSRPRREKSPASPPLLSLRGIQRRWRTARISDFRTIPALHYHQSYGVSACVCFNLQMKMGSRFSQRPWIWWVITIDQQDEIVCSGVWLRQFNSEFQSSDYSSNSDSYTKVVPL